MSGNKRTYVNIFDETMTPCLRIQFTKHLLGFHRNIFRNSLKRLTEMLNCSAPGLFCCSVIMTNTFIQTKHFHVTFVFYFMEVLGNITHCKYLINMLCLFVVVDFVALMKAVANVWLSVFMHAVWIWGNGTGVLYIHITLH